jgi:hypothetical protein
VQSDFLASERDFARAAGDPAKDGDWFGQSFGPFAEFGEIKPPIGG